MIKYVHGKSENYEIKMNKNCKYSLLRLLFYNEKVNVLGILRVVIGVLNTTL